MWFTSYSVENYLRVIIMKRILLRKILELLEDADVSQLRVIAEYIKNFLGRF